MVGQRVGYARVSSIEQNPDRQLDLLGECDRIFTDYASGATQDREALTEMLRHVRKGDELVVSSIDRLARSLVDLQHLVDGLTSRGITVRFITEGLSFTTEREPLAELMLGMLGAFAQFERKLIAERQRAGIEQAKRRGVYRGRAPALTAAQVNELRERVAKGEESKTRLAKEFGISRSTLYNYLEQPD